MSGEETFEHGQEPCTGILLTNLGTPTAPTAAAVRRYLAEFLWDPRVVELPRPLWWLILHGFILRTRPAQSARKYEKIWTDEGSPLLVVGRRQAQAITQELQENCPGPVKLALGMRYGEPSIPAALRELRAAGARRLLVLPLYPQYSATTVASTFDAISKELQTWRWLPELRMITHYHDYLPYISAVAHSILDAWSEEGPAERLLFSFHGLPKRNLLAGDPYHCECHKTAQLVAEDLNMAEGDWAVSFQSRFGGAEWLQPYTSKVLQDWAKAGIKNVALICPGFPADCLETLEEINMENRKLFLDAGGEQFRYIPALNDSRWHIDMLVKLIQLHGSGWPELTTGFDPIVTAKLREQGRQRALELGAAN
ncbi:MAG: ferrochelatase [Candidatus Competibacteraceae bacterium]